MLAVLVELSRLVLPLDAQLLDPQVFWCPFLIDVGQVWRLPFNLRKFAERISGLASVTP